MLPKFSSTYFSILLYSIQFCKIINFIPSCFDHDHLKNISIPGRISYFEEIFNPGFQSTYGFPPLLSRRNSRKPFPFFYWSHKLDIPIPIPMFQIAGQRVVHGHDGPRNERSSLTTHGSESEKKWPWSSTSSHTNAPVFRAGKSRGRGSPRQLSEVV